MIKRRVLFLTYCIFALMINSIPLVGLPFTYLTTIFHEISHVLVALLTGGRIIEFVLSINGSGHVVSTGGIAFFIALSGYLGATLWAVLLFQAGRRPHVARATLTFLSVVLLATILLWVRQLVTVIILIVVLIVIIGLLLKVTSHLITNLVQAMAILVLFNAIKSPLYLIDGRAIGDGAVLSNMTFIPEIIWVSLWCTTGLGVLYWLYLSLDKE